MLWVTMYVTLTDIQNGEPVYLTSVPCTACGGGGGAGGRSLWAHVLPPLAQYQRCYWITRSQMGAPCWTYLTDTTFASWTKRRSGLWVLNWVCMTPPVCEETSGLKRRAGQTPRVLSKDVWARREPHCRRATSSGHPSGDLRASCRGQYVGEHPQRSPLHTVEIHPRRERKVREWSDSHFPSCSTNGWHRGLFPSWRSRYKTRVAEI